MNAQLLATSSTCHEIVCKKTFAVVNVIATLNFMAFWVQPCVTYAQIKSWGKGANLRCHLFLLHFTHTHTHMFITFTQYFYDIFTGAWSVMLTYVFGGLFSLLFTPVIILRFGPRNTILVAQFTYWLYVVANFLPSMYYESLSNFFMTEITTQCNPLLTEQKRKLFLVWRGLYRFHSQKIFAAIKCQFSRFVP